MTDPVGWGILVTAAGAALTNIVIAWRTGKKVDVVADKQIDSAAKLDTITGLGETIKGHVDGAADKAANKITALEDKVNMLYESLRSKDAAALLLAQDKRDKK